MLKVQQLLMNPSGVQQGKVFQVESLNALSRGRLSREAIITVFEKINRRTMSTDKVFLLAALSSSL